MQNARKIGRAGTWQLRLDTLELSCSSTCKANYGRGPDDSFTYADLASSILEEDFASWQQTVTSELQSPNGFETDYRARWPDGSIHAVLVRGQVMDTPPGNPPIAMGISVDLTAQRSAEAELLDAQNRLRATTFGGDVGTWTWDIVNDRVVADPSLQRLFGIDAREAAGGPIDAYLAAIHPDDRVAATEQITSAIDRRHAFEARYRVMGADGKYRVIVARGRAEYDEAGTPLRLPGVVVDVSRETRVEAELRATELRYRTLFDTVDDGFCVLERIPGPPSDFRYLEVNPAFERQSGLSGVLGRTLRQVLDTEADEWIAIYDRLLDTGVGLRFERDLKIRDRYLEVNAFQVPGSTDRVAIVFKDISAQKAAEDQLRANEIRLGEANRAKDDFLAMLGHELRNPLAPISTALELMQMRSPEAFLREREVIARQVAHLSRLVDDLLDVSRITSGKVVLADHRVAIDSVVANAVEIAAPLIEERRHHLSVEVATSAVVRGDEMRLAQIVANLLTNAAKYTEPGGRIDVRATRTGDSVAIHVQDNGTGIRAEVLPLVFEMFVQERQQIDRQRGGLGLGLAIVRMLAQLHGGTVSVRSDGPGRGSCFTVMLPALSANEIAAAPSQVQRSVAPRDVGRRILVVDDNEDAAELLGDALRMRGNDVRVSYDGPAALALVQDFVPEIAVLDIGLPVMDGYELAKRLRLDPRLENLRLIALTGYGTSSDRLKTAEAGFDLHIVKPVNAKQLEAISLPPM